MKPNPEFLLDIDLLTPSQLYISEDKLRDVNRWFRGTTERMYAISVMPFAGRLLITDGHTRAVAAYLAGLRQIPCRWESDDLDLTAYAADISICAEEGVPTVAALAERIVSGKDYRRLWHGRCATIEDTDVYRILNPNRSEESIFFTRSRVPVGELDVRPATNIEYPGYYGLHDGGRMVAYGCIEKYSHEFWEAADIRVLKEHRGHGYGYAITAYITNLILAEGRTATCRTYSDNLAMWSVIRKCGYRELY